MKDPVGESDPVTCSPVGKETSALELQELLVPRDNQRQPGTANGSLAGTDLERELFLTCKVG